MPRLIDPGPVAMPLSLDEAVAALEDMRFDPEAEGAWDTAAPILAALSADRHFLGRVAADVLTGRRETGDAGYGAQVLVLHRSTGPWFLRANFWPAEDDVLVRASGRGAFFYDRPHDHNFSFLTIGHHGPGYESDYWTYDRAGTMGLPDEAITLHHVGRHRLAPGRMMLYRAHLDVHDQKPPAAFSVTLNLMAATGCEPWLDQYGFDPVRGRIERLMNATGIEGLVALAAHLGGEACEDLVRHVAARHPVDRIRFGAIHALAAAAPGEAERLAILAEAASRADRYVAARAARALDRAEAVARWAAEPEEVALDAERAVA